MSKTQLFIPDRVNVGFQERTGTYSGLLAFVIYWDKKGKLRQENSWNSWRHKPETVRGRHYDYDSQAWVSSDKPYGDKVAPKAYDNVPTEGFVLNKKAGGYSTGWNHRQTYCRVYDPRGFEFEISVENLLYILECTNSIIGKGLEGEFVYSWDGKNVVLLPTNSQEYKASKEFTNLQSKKVGRKDMEVGCVYETKKQEKITYLGRHDYMCGNYDSRNGNDYIVKANKLHVFVDDDGKYHTHKGFTKLATRLTTESVSNYSDLLETFLTSPKGDAVKSMRYEPTTLVVQPIDENSYYGCEITNRVYVKSGDEFKTVSYNTHYSRESWNGEFTFDGYTEHNNHYGYKFKGGQLIREYNYHRRYRNNETVYDKETILAGEFYELYVTLEGGKEYRLEEYYKVL